MRTVVFLSLVLSATHCALAAGAEAQRWINNAHGLILQPPESAAVQELATGDDMVQFTSPNKGDYAIKVSLRIITGDMNLDIILKAAIAEIKVAQPSATVIDQRITKVEPYDAAWVYYRIPDRQRSPVERYQPKANTAPEPWMFAQAFVAIDSRRLVIFQLSVTNANMYEKGREVFEQVFQSLQVRDPKVLDEQRKQLIEAGKTAWSVVTPEVMEKTLIPVQLFRILSEGRDVGYMRMRQGKSRQMDLDGIEVDVQSRILDGIRALDSQSNLFLSWDRQTEVWSIRITNRPLQKPRKGEKVQPETTFSETGLRSGTEFSVTRDSLGGLKKYQWTVPPEGYLNMVEAVLLGPLMKQAKDVEMGFYAYVPGTGKVPFRQDKLQRRADGSYQITTRPAPESSETISMFDSTGRLLKQSLPGKREMVPTTEQQITALWKLKSP